MNFVNAVVSGTSADPDGSSRANGCVSADRLELHCISRELRVEPSHLILSPTGFYFEIGIRAAFGMRASLATTMAEMTG